MDYRVYNTRQAESARVHMIKNGRRFVVDTVEPQKTAVALKSIDYTGFPMRKKDKIIAEPK